MTCLFVFLEQIVRESIDHSRHSYDHVSNSLASGRGIRVRHRWYAVPRRDNSRDSVSEQKMRLCRTHDRSRALFSLVPRLRFSEILREIASRYPMVIRFLFAIQFSTIEILILSKFSLEIFEKIWGNWR